MIDYKEFALKMFKEMSVEVCDENLVISPISIITLLMMLAATAEGDTRDEIISCLSQDESFFEMKEDIQKLASKLSKSGVLKNANAALINSSIGESIKDEFKETMKKVFDGQVIISDKLLEDTDKWVVEKTNGMIPKITDESMKAALACLINAICFEDEWEEEYEEDDISSGEFTNADGRVSNVTMLESFEWTYLEDEFYTGFCKPYKNGFSFLGLLPKEKSASDIKYAVNHLDIPKLLENSKDCKVLVNMPEFKAEYGRQLNDLFKKWGIHQAFKSTANFSGMSNEWLKIDQIIHKAKIEVDRKGTKASAVSMGFVVAGCGLNCDIKYVILDRPFVYAIVHDESRIPVFMGQVNRL